MTFPLIFGDKKIAVKEVGARAFYAEGTLVWRLKDKKILTALKNKKQFIMLLIYSHEYFKHFFNVNKSQCFITRLIFNVFKKSSFKFLYDMFILLSLLSSKYSVLRLENTMFLSMSLFSLSIKIMALYIWYLTILVHLGCCNKQKPQTR